MSMRKPALVIAVMAFTACGQGSLSPTTPTTNVPTGPSEEVGEQGSTALDNVPDFSEPLALVGGDADVVSLWDPKAKVKLVSAPPAGTTFKLDSAGIPKAPTPAFKIEVVPSKNVKQGGAAVIFLTAGGAECGLGVSYPVALKANTPKQVTPKLFLVGPSACSLLGPSCWANGCELPLTTTKFRMHFGGDYTAFAKKTITRTYRWEE